MLSKSILIDYIMAYSKHGHFSYILEASSKRPNDFSLTGKKPNEILKFKWKKLMALNILIEIKLKIHAEGKWNNKNNERELKQNGINASKRYILCI